MNNEQIKGLKISLASQDMIRSWSHGAVTNSETLSYKTGLPEKGGLFCQAIFGPLKDYQCACGKYSKDKYAGKICEKCGVEVTKHTVRRERMGHIDLNTPVAHPWMMKSTPSPSKIALVLGISSKDALSVIYYHSFIVIDAGSSKIFRKKDVVSLNAKETSTSHRKKIREVLLGIIKDLEGKGRKNIYDYAQLKSYIELLKDTSLALSIHDVLQIINRYTGLRFGTGAAAIQELLQKVNVDNEIKALNVEIKKYRVGSTEFSKIQKRLQLFLWLKTSGNQPEWMILSTIPVSPPETRPLLELANGIKSSSDLNDSYRAIIIRNDRLKELERLGAPEILLDSEKRLLQDAVDTLFDNGARSRPKLNRDKVAIKSLTDKLKGKDGVFRQHLLGKRVDFSGRSVIVVGPELKMYEAGLPAIMIIKLFKPFILSELMKNKDEFGNEIVPIASSWQVAEKMIAKQEPEIWPIVNKIIKDRPILLNRAPTLHSLGIQAFEPKIIDGSAIRLHPLVTTAFNADFDGDQMGVHVPLSPEAINEARSVLLASWHILGPKDGKPVITPTQDMIVGVYYLSSVQKGKPGEGIIFSSVEETLQALACGVVHPHTIVGISTKAFPKKFKEQETLITTVGKIIINSSLPEDMPYINDAKLELSNSRFLFGKGQNIKEIIEKWDITSARSFTKSTLQSIVVYLNEHYPVEVVAKTMDQIKALGFKYSTMSATTMSVYDIPQYQKEKQKVIDDSDKEISNIRQYFEEGLISDDERYLSVIKVWNKAKNDVQKGVEKLVNDINYKHNSVIAMANSGARGNITQLTQLIGLRGLMSKSYNYDQKHQSNVIKDTIEIPIKRSFLEGLTISDFFNSSFGARKGMADTAMKTSKAGYMTRKLVDVSQEVTVTADDCGSTRGIIVEDVVEVSKDGAKKVIVPLYDRIVHRYAVHDICKPDSKDIIVSANQAITPALAKEIVKCGIKQVEVRSVLTCRCPKGVCQKCFGNDLTTNNLVKLNTAVGVIAAQSIGEPGTQLTMRTFHTGGIASEEGSITQGFERLKQLFDLVPPKEWETANISPVAGVVVDDQVKDSDDGKERVRELIIKNKYTGKEEKVDVSIHSVLKVKVGSEVECGAQLTTGLSNVKEILRCAGLNTAIKYLYKEIQKVYRSQGIEISDKYIEIILKQMSSKVIISNAGDSNRAIGEYLDIETLRKENSALIAAKKAPIIAFNTILGLEDVPNKGDSFLSAASFLDTKSVLATAAIRGSVDSFYGLKENVMIGGLIPAGTGKKSSEEVIKTGQEMYKKEY